MSKVTVHLANGEKETYEGVPRWRGIINRRLVVETFHASCTTGPMIDYADDVVASFPSSSVMSVTVDDDASDIVP